LGLRAFLFVAPAQTEVTEVTDKSYTVNSFCEAEHISRATYYNMKNRGEGPRTYKVGNSDRITEQARQDWHAEREAAAAKIGGAR
jgi:hypothetical protein